VPLDGRLTPGGSPGWARIALTVLSVLAILVATLRSQSGDLPRSWSLALISGDEGPAEVVQNIILFVPLGLMLALGPWRAWRCIAAGALLSLAVEVTQQWLPGRDPSVGDLVFNTLGTAIGVLLARTAPSWVAPPRKAAAWLSFASAVLAAAVWLGTGCLLRPMLPVAAALETRTPDLGPHMDIYSGRVLSVTGRLAVNEPLRIVATAGTPSTRFAPILDVDDGPGPAGTIVAADRTDLVLRNRSRSMFLGLDRPDLRARGALAGVAPQDTIVITARSDGDRPAFCLGVNENEWCGLGYTMGDGWRLIFYPEHFPPFALQLLNALWMAGWCLGIGWWGRRHPATGVALGVVALTLLVGPGLVGLLATPIWEMAGAVVGVGILPFVSFLSPTRRAGLSS
jgi:AcrR family transcriptional regulator